MSTQRRSDNVSRGVENSRSRQIQPEVTTPRRSRSAEGSRPQYKDSRRQFVRPRDSSIEVQAFYHSHQIAPSEPTFHEVDETRAQHSRSLSPGNRRKVTATPYDPFLIESRNRDLYQKYAEEAYSQRYANWHASVIDQDGKTNSLLMFGDAVETASALTGWSEQELIQKQKNATKKEKNYAKKKKNKEPRILNMPLNWKGNTEAPIATARKRYFRGANGPNGAMTRGVVGGQTGLTAKDDLQANRKVAAMFPQSSDVESTQSSNDSREGASNDAVRRWLQTKAKRKHDSDFPLLSTNFSKTVSSVQPGRDAPGPVARRASPVLQYEINNPYGGPEEPVEQMRLFKSDNTPPSKTLRNPVSILEKDWMLSISDMDSIPNDVEPLHFSSDMGNVVNKRCDMPDDGSPTSVIPSQTFNDKSTFERSSSDSNKPKSILRNSPRSPARRPDGTHPLSDRKNILHYMRIEGRPREIRTRFSDSVEQRTYDNREHLHDATQEQESNYFNDYSDQGAFPVQRKDQIGDAYERYELEKMVEELLGGGRNQSSTANTDALNSLRSTEAEHRIEGSLARPSHSVSNVDESSSSPTRQIAVSEAQTDRRLEEKDVPRCSETALSQHTEQSRTFEEPVTNEVQNQRSFPLRHKSELNNSISSSDMVEPWVHDVEFATPEDKFDSSDEMAFILVVAAVVIQSTVRRFLAVLLFERRVAAQIKREVQSPPVVFNQAQAFKKAEKAQSGEGLQKLSDRTHEHSIAATTIQSVFRSWWVRDSLHVDHYCATHAQRIVRGFLARTNFYYDMYCIILVQAYARMIMAREEAAGRLASVVLIQAYVRGSLTRKRVVRVLPQRSHYLTDHIAAVKLQSLCRSFLMHQRFLDTLADVLITQSVARRWLVNTVVIPRLTGRKRSVSAQIGESQCEFDRQQVECEQRSTACLATSLLSTNGVTTRPPRAPSDSIDVSSIELHLSVAKNAAFGSARSISTVNSEPQSNQRYRNLRDDSVSSIDSRPGSDDPLMPLRGTPNRGPTALVCETPMSVRSIVNSPSLEHSMTRRAVAVVHRDLSFEHPSSLQYRPYTSLSFDETKRSHRPAVNANRVVRKRDEVSKGGRIELDMQPNVPIGVSPRRKIPKNSAAAFWEQKTANQPKPAFPPKGWR